MVRVVLLSACIGSAAAYTGSNSAYMPGNWNLPQAGPLGNTFGADVAKTLPEINVRYMYPAHSAQALAASVEDGMALDSRIATAAQELASDKAFISALAPSSFLRKGDQEIMAALNTVKMGPSGATGMDGFAEMMLGMSHSPRPTFHGAAAAATTCNKSYSGCPTGFAASGSGCSATAAYSGPCSGTYNFSTFSPAMKQRFEEQCGASWSCA